MLSTLAIADYRSLRDLIAPMRLRAICPHENGLRDNATHGEGPGKVRDARGTWRRNRVFPDCNSDMQLKYPRGFRETVGNNPYMETRSAVRTVEAHPEARPLPPKPPKQ
jgi:hypothetical protein